MNSAAVKGSSFLKTLAGTSTETCHLQYSLRGLSDKLTEIFLKSGVTVLTVFILEQGYFCYIQFLNTLPGGK